VLHQAVLEKWEEMLPSLEGCLGDFKIKLISK
jgi:hypothetical protein